VGALSWCGAIAGWVAALSIGTFVIAGARRRRSYDAWRDTMTDLGDGLDGVATAFVVVNLVVAGLLGVLAGSVQHALRSWAITITVIVAAVGSFVFGLTACEKRCRYPRCEGTAPRWLHGVHLLAAGVVVTDIIAAPFITWFALQHRNDDFTVFRIVSLVLGSAAAVLTAVLLQQAWAMRRADRAGRASSAIAGLFERLVWVVGYGWVVALACTVVRPGWPPAFALGLWLALALWFVLRPDWRDPSLWFSLDDCQPGTLESIRNVTCGVLWVGTVEDPVRFRDQLCRALDTRLIKGRTDSATCGVTVAFTVNGLRTLGVQYRWHAAFVEDAFGQGMQARAQSLGDTGPNDPTHWDGGWRDPEHLHVAFWIQAGTINERKALTDDVTGHFTSVQRRLDVPTKRLTSSDGQSQEPFGFVDGISQPWIDGVLPRRRDPKGGGKVGARGRSKPLALGEFVVGQADETGDIFPVPAPPEVFLGGTFLVVRKLQQDVARFRSYADDPANPLAARLIGRTQSGAPLEPPDDTGDPNDFTYGQDPEGLSCPIGAHIRRANPRDALGFGSTLSVRRRIIRRGMPYDHRSDDASDQTDQGLVFLAYNVRIAEQFEFIQKQWLNDASPFGFGNIPDPVSGLWPPGSPRSLVVTGSPPEVRAGLPSFVTTKGGEYFFVPSVPGLRAIAAL
jgi:Dyp-type peroxidase family